MPPAIPLLVAGAAAAGSALTGMAALGAGLAAVGGGSALLGGVVIAGSALSTIGMVTGNQKLSKIGNMVALVGGVGALANGLSAAASSSLSDVAQQATISETSMADVAGEAMPSATAAQAGGVSMPAEPSMSLASEGSGGLLAAENPSLGTFADAKVPVRPLVPGAEGATGVAAGEPSFSPTEAAPAQAAKAAPAAAAEEAPKTTLGKIGEAVTKVGKVVKDNKELANITGGLLYGGMQDYSKQKALSRQADIEREAEERRVKRISDSVKGTQAPVYVPPTTVPKRG